MLELLLFFTALPVHDVIQEDFDLAQIVRVYDWESRVCWTTYRFWHQGQYVDARLMESTEPIRLDCGRSLIVLTGRSGGRIVTRSIRVRRVERLSQTVNEAYRHHLRYYARRRGLARLPDRFFEKLNEQ